MTDRCRTITETEHGGRGTMNQRLTRWTAALAATVVGVLAGILLPAAFADTPDPDSTCRAAVVAADNLRHHDAVANGLVVDLALAEGAGDDKAREAMLPRLSLAQSARELATQQYLAARTNCL